VLPYQILKKIFLPSAAHFSAGWRKNMPTPLDMLFQAADGLPAPQPGHYVIQLRVTVKLMPEGVTWQGTLQYTRRTEFRTKKELSIEPAFFSGSTGLSSGSGSPLKLTISGPEFGIASWDNYAVDFSIQSSPPLTGGFVPESLDNDPGAYYCQIYSTTPIANFPTPQTQMIITVLSPPMGMRI
jgi:hypothetical protein